MGNVSYTELLGKGQQALSAGNWQQAKKLFTDAVNVNSRGAEAWLGLLLAEEQCYVFEDYVEKRIEYYKSKVDAGKVTLRAYKSHINEMVQKYALGTYLSAERIESEYNSVEAVYGVREADSWRQLRKTAEADWNSSKSLSNAERYAQGYFIDEMKDGKRAYLARFDELAKQAALKETSERKKAEAEIRTLTAQADQRVKNLHAKQKDAIEEDYTSFVRSAYAADDSTKLLIAAVKLESLGGYKDSATRAKRCREKAAEIAGGAESKQRKAEEEQRDLDEAIARRRRDTSTVREKNDLDDEIEKRRREIEEYKRRMLGAEAGETEAERKRKAEEEAKRKREAEEAERKRKAEEAAKRKREAEEAERKRKAEEAAKRKREAEEAERKRKAEEAAKRKREAEEEEKRRRKAEIDEKLRRMAEEAERPVEEEDDSLAEIFRVFNIPAKGQEQRETTRTSADEDDEDPFDPIFRLFETPPEYEKKQTPNAAPEQRAGEKLLGSEFAIPSGIEAKRKREEEEKRKREAEEAKRKREAEEKAAKDAARLLQEAAERAKRKLLEEEEAKRKKAEEEARRKAEEEARRKREAEEREARRKAAEEEAKRKREEEERRAREKERVEQLLREQDERLRKEAEQNEKLRIESEKKYAARRLEEQKIHKAERAEKRKKSMKYVVAIILIAAILVGVFFVFTKKNSPSNTYPHADSISVADVSREPVPDPNSPEALALEPALPSPRTLT